MSQTSKNPRLTIRLPDGMRERVEKEAEREHRSMSSLIVHATAKYLERKDRRREHHQPAHA